MLDEYLYLRDIIEACEDIEEFTEGISKEQFLASKLIRWAVVQRLTVIGEGAAKMTDELKSRHPSVIWKQITGTRNILVHSYFRIDWEIIWDTVRNDIAPLRMDVQTIIDEDFRDRLEESNI